MNNRKRIIFWLFLFCLASFLPPVSTPGLIQNLNAWGRKEKAATVQITGTVRLVGSGPMAEVLISGQNGQWYIAKEDKRKLAELQHRTVTVEGVETVEELFFANGHSAGTRHTLSRIKIIHVM